MRLGVSFFVTGLVLTIFGVSMLVPLLVDLSDVTVGAFGLSSGITLFFGILFMLMFRDNYAKLTSREMFLTTTLVWMSVCAFCALPFYFSDTPAHYTDAFFETMSGITTMGATMITDLDHTAKGILLWRALLQWVGGLGIIIIALAILPMLRIGGMQLFSLENSDRSGKNMPKTSQIVATLMMVYVTVTIICILSLFLAGMSPFDAVAYTLTTVPSGGFAPYDSSAALLTRTQQWVIIFFMFVSGLPLFFLYFIFVRDWEKVKNDTQVKTFFFIVLILSAAVTLWMVRKFPERPFEDIVRMVTFNILSIITTCGLTTEDFMKWGTFPVMVFLFLIPLGGCSGSTTGGFKTFRLNILYFFTLKNLRMKILPHGVFMMKFNGEPITDDVVSGVFLFFSMFLICFFVSCLSLSVCGLDFISALSGSLSALGNVGPALGKVIGPAGSYAGLPVSAKWILCLDMMLGRLEYMAVLVLLTPLAWRKEHNKKSLISF